MEADVSSSAVNPPPRAAAVPEWVVRPERATPAMMRFIVWVALTLGRRAARLLLPPICVYFMVSDRAVRAASRQYLDRALGRKAVVADGFLHVYTFAATILDRVFLLNGQYAQFDITVHGEPLVQRLLDAGGGCLLLGAHMGSFEVVRSLGREERGLNIAMTMYQHNARKVQTVLAAINPRLTMQVIQLGTVDAMLRVKEALVRGEFVGMLGDRTFAGEGTMPIEFLGEPAHFPLGPFRMAAMLKRPVVIMFGLYRGGNRYEIHFEELPMQTEGRGRAAAMEAAMHHYAARLEHFCRIAPYNWFNFYRYWNKETPPHEHE